MKYEMRIEYENKSELNEVINKSYFTDGNQGKLLTKDNLRIPNEDPVYIMLKGLNNMTVRVTNEDLIDGCSRFVVDEHADHINLIPCSNYCIIEDGKYSFY